MAEPKTATLFNPLTGERKAIIQGSQAEKKLSGKGFKLETPIDKFSKEGAFQEATRQFADFQFGQPAFQDEVRSQLRGRTPQLRENFGDLNTRFGTPGSSEFIENPQVRNQVIESFLTGGKTTLSGLLDRANAQFGLAQGRSQAQLGLAEQAFGNQQAEQLRQQQRQESLDDLRKELGIRAEFKTPSGSGLSTTGRTLKTFEDLGFIRQPNEVGGFSFFDENGNPVSVDDAAQQTGVTQATLLKGSLDPGDIQRISLTAGETPPKDATITENQRQVLEAEFDNAVSAIQSGTPPEEALTGVDERTKREVIKLIDSGELAGPPGFRERFRGFLGVPQQGLTRF